MCAYADLELQWLLLSFGETDNITFICNHSIHSSTFPNKWKEAKVSPLYKNGPQDDVNNYRLISILPVLSKVIEKHGHDCLYGYIHENNLLH